MTTPPRVTEAQLCALRWLPDDGSFRPRMVTVQGRRTAVSIRTTAPAVMTLLALMAKGLATGDQATDAWAITPEGRRARDVWTLRRNRPRQMDIDDLRPRANEGGGETVSVVFKPGGEVGPSRATPAELRRLASVVWTVSRQCARTEGEQEALDTVADILDSLADAQIAADLDGVRRDEPAPR
jgi:hypothetical protein